MSRITLHFRVLLLMLLVYSACKQPSALKTEKSVSADILIECNRKLTDAQVERHFTPPVAARNYSYPNIAVYMALEPFYDDYQSLSGQLTELQATPQPDTSLTYDLELVSFHTFMTVALELIYRDTIISNFSESRLKAYASALDESVYQRSVDYAASVAGHILQWADGDMYRQTRNYQEFAPSKSPYKWKPTSPDYMPAIEPSWKLIRPYVLDSAQQFRPIRPTEVDFKPGSPFYLETMQVFDAVNKGTEEHREIANFWDCNPNISHHHGHYMFFLQKISPGGHWVHIALQSLEAKKMNIDQGAATMAMLTIALHDAFIACWDEKYNSNYIRPETVIKAEIDKKWDPILQTPAFPEYPSGHSVASAAAATILTDVVDESFHFIDSTEVPYGLKTRTFNSFRQASDEAAISRLYGGIHFMPAITEGIKMGNNVGNLVLECVQIKKKS